MATDTVEQGTGIIKDLKLAQKLRYERKMTSEFFRMIYCMHDIHPHTCFAFHLQLAAFDTDVHRDHLCDRRHDELPLDHHQK